jgi:endoglucanase
MIANVGSSTRQVWRSTLPGGGHASAARRFRAASRTVAVIVLCLLGAASAAGKDDDAARSNAWLGRGVNLGNAFDAPSNAVWAVRLRGDYFLAIKRAGFNSVRIPVAWTLHAGVEPPYAIDPLFLQKVDWAIGQALSQDLAVVLDVHHDVDMDRRPDQSLPRLTAIWTQLAQHYRDYPSKLFFELLNEPSGALTDDKWQEAMPIVLQAVRQSNPTRTVIVGPGYWNTLDHLDNLHLPADDKHLIVTFHYYLPLKFTHQGAAWMPGSDKWKGETWVGSAEQRAALDRDFDKAGAWATRNSRPLYLGEFGAIEGADMDSRARWTRAVVEAARRRGFSFAYWEFCSNFGAYDPVALQWRAPLLHALMDNDVQGSVGELQHANP